MIRKNRKILGFLSAVADMLLTLLSYIVAVNIRFDILDGHVSIDMMSTRFMLVAAAYSVAVVLCYTAFHLYQPLRIRVLRRDVLKVAAIDFAFVLLLAALSFVVRIIDVSRGTLFLFWLVSTLLVSLRMVAAEKLLRYLRSTGRNLRHVIIIGNGKSALNYVKEVREQSSYGIVVDGYISKVPREGLGENLGSYEDLEQILENGEYDELVVALEPHEAGFMRNVLMAAEKEGIRVEMIPFYNEYFPRHPTLESYGDTTLVDLRATPLDNIALAAVKRLADILVSLVLLILLSPLLLVIAAGVKLSSPGPVLFKQERVGKDKKPFQMLKFRSMRTDIDHNGWTKNNDPRKTKFGSLIRKFSLDELPQLWNVLVGQMSLVGPRPELPYYVQRFKEEVPLYLVRQQVRPGMTGWAQIHGLRGDTSIEKRVEYDIWYIQNWSISLDLRILMKTAFGGMINHEALK